MGFLSAQGLYLSNLIRVYIYPTSLGLCPLSLAFGIFMKCLSSSLGEKIALCENINLLELMLIWMMCNFIRS